MQVGQPWRTCQSLHTAPVAERGRHAKGALLIEGAQERLSQVVIGDAEARPNRGFGLWAPGKGESGCEVLFIPAVKTGFPICGASQIKRDQRGLVGWNSLQHPVGAD